MLDIHYIRTHTARVVQGLEKRRFDHAATFIKELLAIDQQRRTIQASLDNTTNQLNLLTRKIGRLVEDKQVTEVADVKAQTTLLKQTIQTRHKELRVQEEVLRQKLCQLPNLPHAEVPEGKDASDNTLVYQSNTTLHRDPTLLPHWELARKYTLIDFEAGNKVAGAGFPVYRHRGARLQRALVNFLLDEAVRAGYEEIQPPLLTHADAAYGTGQLPDKEGQMYQLQNAPYYLIPTAEVPLTNLHRGEILSPQTLPIKTVAYTPCFRREAGTWGKQVRGLNRLHQFDKVELVEVRLPESSHEALQVMLAYVQSLLDQLALPYRIVKLCGGDLGFTAALTYDLEVWSAGQQRWLEVSSVSNFEAYQARRLQLRYRDEQRKIHLLHTLNGSALALPRIMAALLENNQTQHSIDIPPVLWPYTGFTSLA